MTIIRRVLAAALLAAPLLAQPAPAQDKSLYQRIGGYDAIAAVTDDFIARMVADDKLKRFFVVFSEDSRGKIRQHVIDLICKSSGGPCVYTGRDMKTSHAGAGVTKADWDKSVALFLETLNKFKVPEREQKELAGLILPLEKDIVEK
jgi:hemoglobin